MLPPRLRPSLAELSEEIRTRELRILALEHQLAAPAAQLPHVAHLRTMPEVGVLNATACHG